MQGLIFLTILIAAACVLWGALYPNHPIAAPLAVLGGFVIGFIAGMLDDAEERRERRTKESK